jgi:hypothetical protein
VRLFIKISFFILKKKKKKTIIYGKMKLKHPYNEFEESQLWKLVDEAICDLIENQDIKLTTRKEYVIGYICKVLNISCTFHPL